MIGRYNRVAAYLFDVEECNDVSNFIATSQCARFRDNIELSRIDQRLTFLPSGALRIDNALMSDAGMYECHALSDAGNATKLMHLIVQGE